MTTSASMVSPPTVKAPITAGPTSGHRPAGSYNPAETTAGGRDAECARLEAQAALSFDVELAQLDRLGLTGALVELGAGPGAVSRRLMMARPELPLIAVDIDPDLLSRNPAALRVVGDGSALPVRTGTAGCVLIRYVLQHVPNPSGILGEALRVLRPGGSVVVTDVDDAMWGMADPVYPDVAGVQRALARAQCRRGGNRSIGRSLTRMLRAAGFERPSLHPFAVTNDDRPTAAFAAHLGPDRLVPLVASGDLAIDAFAVATLRWKQFLADPDAWIALFGLTAVGTKPAPAAMGCRLDPIRPDRSTRSERTPS